MSFIFKIDRLIVAIARYKAEGGDMRPIEAELAEIERLVQQGRFDAAELRLGALVTSMRRGPLRPTA